MPTLTVLNSDKSYHPTHWGIHNLQPLLGRNTHYSLPCQGLLSVIFHITDSPSNAIVYLNVSLNLSNKYATPHVVVKPWHEWNVKYTLRLTEKNQLIKVGFFIQI